MRLDFDELDRPIRREIGNLITSYQYDPSGRRVQVNEGDKASIWSYLSQCELPTLNRTSVLDPISRRTIQEYWISITYNASCLPTSVFATDQRTLSFLYGNEAGHALVVDELGRSISLTYSTDVRLPSKMSDGSKNEVNISYNNSGEISGMSPENQSMLSVLESIRSLLVNQENCFCSTKLLFQRDP
jgi:hypothetical protein